LVLVGCILATFPLDKKINLGLDLKGGMHLLLKVDTSGLSGEAKVTRRTGRLRLSATGLTNSRQGTTIQRQGADEIVVQLPGVTDRDRAIEIIGKTALLELSWFRRMRRN